MSRIKGEVSRYGIYALRDKRAEIDRDLGQLKLQVAQKRRELAQVDAALRLLDPSYAPSQIAPKKAIKYLNIFRQGELGRLIIGVLRAADGPMSNLEIAQIILDRGGFDHSLWTAIRRRCRANLAYLEDQGRVAKIGTGAATRWASQR